MHRVGNIIQECVAYQNVASAYDRVLRGTRRKRTRQGRLLLKDRDGVINSIINTVGSGEFRNHGYRERDIVEAGKRRHLQILSMFDRMCQNSVMTPVDAVLKRRFIRTTSASIKERGMHDLKAYIERDLRDDPKGTRYCYMFDIRRCYESTDQELTKKAVRKIFKDPKLLAILDDSITMLPTGVSLGARPSQGLVNLLLSIHLDHPLKSHYRVKHYYRYCDNGEVLAETKKECWAVRDLVHELLEPLGYELHHERVFPVTEGIDALGYVIYPTHSLIRKRIKQKFAKKMGKVKSRKRRAELKASFYGMAKHAQCNHLYKVLTGTEMKSFKDLNVAYKPDDGKKRFPGAVVSIRELVNLPIVIRDFETGVKTSQGEDRCVVAIEQNGEQKKFFTNSEEMKNILQQVSEMPDGFPFETTIKAETFGKGKTKYVFT